MARGAQPKETPQIRMELGKLRQLIRDKVGVIQGAQSDRLAHNSDIQAARTELEAQGIPKKALAAAMAYLGWDADARAGFDNAYVIVREALGCPMEDQLFDHKGEPTDAATGAGKKGAKSQPAVN